jgi:hypothetical protein
MNKLPNLLLVGAQKAATSSLVYYLKQHPEVYFSESKELFFFCSNNLSSGEPDIHTNKLLQNYKVNFNSENQKIVGEATTHYLYKHHKVIENLRNVYGDECRKIKILIMLRNPAERAFSAWSMFKKNNVEILNFKEALAAIDLRLDCNDNCNFDYLGFGLYYQQVKSYFDNFDNVYVSILDDFESNPIAELNNICSFLGIYDFKFNTKAKVNKSGVIKIPFIYDFMANPSNIKTKLKKLIPDSLRKSVRHVILGWVLKSEEIQTADLKSLKDYYLADIEQLELLLNKELSSWK